MQLQDCVSWPPQGKDLEPEKFTLLNKLNLIMKLLLNDKDELSHTNRLRYLGKIYKCSHKRKSKNTQEHSSFYDEHSYK